MAASNIELIVSIADERSVKNENSHGSPTPSMERRIAPKGYTEGFGVASTTADAGTANFVGVCDSAGSNNAVFVRRKHTCLANTNISPLSNGFSPLQHPYTPRRGSELSRSRNRDRAHAATFSLSAGSESLPSAALLNAST